LPLVFETLIRLDANGEPQPGLAESWEHDAAARHWDFHLRASVKFHDGTPLTPETAASAIANADPAWRISTGGDAVRIETPQASPDLPILLSESRYALVHRAEKGAFAGTGPFKNATWEAGKHCVFAANEEYWARRAFLDSVDVQMGRASRDRMIDLELGK